MRVRHQVAIIGAGISGLCAAHFLRERGIDVIVLERDGTVGGTMKTIREDGWLVETGPNSALETTPLFGQLFDQLGITNEHVYANEEASKRYILRNGTLHPLPMSPIAFLRSQLWSPGGKLRLLKEPFVGRAKIEESIAQFVERRLGREFLDYAINPFVAGVYAGNPEELSVQSAFPKLYALEENYGGLIKGMILGRKERKRRAEKAKDRARLFSFKEGMQTFPNAIADRLGDRVRLNSTVERVVPLREGAFPVYHISYTQGGKHSIVRADAVILAAPAHQTAQIIQPIDPEMSAALGSIYYPPVAVAYMGFRTDQIIRPLDGFGFLVPQKEDRKILGTIWSSTLFPHRAPDGHVALTTFIGGARQPQLALLDDQRLTEVVLSDLRPIMGIDGRPIYQRIFRWEKAIPQYTLGYHRKIAAMERFEENFRGSYLCSNYRGGIAVGDCVMSAERIAVQVTDYLDNVRRARG